MKWKGVIDAYRDFLPVSEKTPVVTLYEGNTVLLPAPRLSEKLKVEIYLKFEGQNPTGSFKDRGMTVAVSKALESGAQAVMCASTGNTSASAAAYAARAGLKCIVLVPDGYIALGKLAQALIYGAEVIAIQGNFDAALRLVRKITQEHPIVLVNSINPHRIEGQKTAAFEVCDQLGFVPDYLALPVGNAGNITAYWKGFREYYEAGCVDKTPRMLGFQAEGAAPIVRGEVVPEPQTVATAIRIGNPASWQGALNAVRESGGRIDMVSDEEILSAYQMVAREEGLFVEPASAAALAGVVKLSREGFFPPLSKVVCIMTGHGLKDPDTTLKTCKLQPTVVPPEERAVLDVLRKINVL
ncbi:MAG: Threonine synthase [Thermoanaerobacterales bacterium 50_218]|nr:MAG: Threonine synthase [Thermoanaerobacterales bacterium 50_218]HAA89498.1 threonine synthase [Peptococcaceae bacterium]